MHPRALVAEIDSLSLTTFAGYFLNYCKTIVEKHGVTAFIMSLSPNLPYKLKGRSCLLAVFLVQGKVEMEI